MYLLLIALLSLIPLMQGCGDQESPLRSPGTAAKLTASAVQVGSGQGGDIRFLRPPTYADSLANGLIGDEVSDTATAPAETVRFVVSGTITNETGRDLSEVKIIAVWNVVSGSPDYSYIFGKTTPKGILAEDYDYGGMTAGGATRHCVIFNRNYTVEDE